MKTDFLNYIEKHKMLSRGMSICVGVSGGADSMCLLHLLNSVRDYYDLKIIAAHVNHCIRGEEADADEKFVCDYCKVNGIQFVSRRINVPEISALTGESTELCARRMRYEFFDELSTDVIATAHTGSDRIETLLMNLSRGAALDGLCSIPPVRGTVIRPLLGFTRREIEEYCASNNIGYVTDSTNLTDDYTRNRFRHKVVAELIDIYPSFENNALRCLELINEDNDFLDAIVEEKLENLLGFDFSLRLNGLFELNDVLKRRIIIGFLKKNNIFDYSYKHIGFIAANLNKKFSLMLPSGKRISGDGERVFVDDLNKASDSECEVLEFKKTESIEYYTSDAVLSVYPVDSLKDVDVDRCFIIDFDKADDTLRFRPRMAGDIIHLGKRKCSKSLKKFFNELKIPVEKRRNIAVLADNNGVIAIEHIAVDSTRCAEKNTKRFLIIEMKGCNYD